MKCHTQSHLFSTFPLYARVTITDLLLLHLQIVYYIFIIHLAAATHGYYKPIFMYFYILFICEGAVHFWRNKR